MTPFLLCSISLMGFEVILNATRIQLPDIYWMPTYPKWTPHEDLINASIKPLRQLIYCWCQNLMLLMWEEQKKCNRGYTINDKIHRLFRLWNWNFIHWEQIYLSMFLWIQSNFHPFTIILALTWVIATEHSSQAKILCHYHIVCHSCLYLLYSVAGHLYSAFPYA